MSKQVQVSIKHSSGAMSNATVDVNHGPSGRPMVIKGQPGSSYQLKDMLTGTAPDQVLVKRKGNSLHIRLLDERDAAVGAETAPDIVIENFYDDPNASLTGQAENGSLYNYLPQEGDAAHLIEHLADGASSYQSLGYSQAAPAAAAGAASVSPWLLAPLAGLALAGGSSHHAAGQTIAPVPAPLPAPDAVAPSRPTLTATDDVAPVAGTIANGATTNDNLPLLSGAAEPGATVKLSIDGGAPVTVVADGAGNWSYTPPTALADGRHTVSITATDAAGNVSPAATLGFTVDTGIPAAPTLVGTDDRGATQGAIVHGSTIDDSIPALGGTAEPGAKLTLVIDGTNPVEVIADGSGHWRYTPPALADGLHNVTVTQTDAAGNVSPPVTLAFTIDTGVPALPTVTAADDVAPVIGPVANGSTTNDNLPVLSGTAEAGATVALTIAGPTPSTVTLTAAADGSWSYAPSMLTDGAYSISVTQSDAAGNVSPAATLAFTVDTSVPTATSSIAAITTDSGASSSDFVTSDNTLAIVGTNTALGAGEIVQLSRDGGANWVAVTPVTATSWSYNNTGTVLADGTYNFQTRVVDAAGNVGTVSSRAVVIDTAAPTATSSITAVTTDSATAGDFVTNDPTLLVSGTNTALGSGEVVQVSLDGGLTWVATTPVTATSWSFDNTGAVLADGTYSFQTRVIDTAGLTGPVASQAVRIDTGVPTAPGLTATDDQAPVTGAIANGATTNDNQPALGGAAEPGATITITIDGTPVTVTADAAGNWSYTPAALAEGVHSVSVTQTDAAGNVSPATALSFTTDTTVPAAPTLTATDDVAPVMGAIANGSTTNDNVPVLSGAAEPNATVTLTIDGTPVAVTANGAGVWSFTPAALADGVHSVSVTQTDAAGNVSPAATLGFTVDTAAPAAPTLIGTDDVAAMTGAIANGSTTNDNVPVLAGTAEPNAAVTVSIDGTPVTVTADDAGNWSYAPPALADGAHSVSVTQTDAAGNVSPAAVLSFTVDATAPATPAFTGTDDVAPVTGTIVDGSTINDVRPAISGTTAEPNATVTVSISGPSDVTATVVADGAGVWSFTPGIDLVDGSYSVTVTQTDAAGNTSLAGAPLTFTLDSAAPLSISTITAITNDSGISSSDFVTNDPTLVIGGSNSPLAVGEVVQISLDGGATWVATTPVTATSWSFDNSTSTLADGTYSFQTRVTDAAGNVGTPSSQAVTVDATAPSASSAITAISTDSGIAGDFVTSDNTLAISGANTALGSGEAVQLSLDGGATWVATMPVTATSWSYNNTGAVLADGAYNFQTRVIDAAGNTGTVSSQAVTVDTAAPSATSAITVISADTGTAGDFITNDTDGLTVTGSNTALAAGEVVQISLDGGATWAATTSMTATSWTHATAPLGSGSYSFQTRVIDAGGLIGPVASQAVVIDAGVPAAPGLAASDDVAPVIGSITAGSTTNDAQPTLSGTAEPNATVTLTIDGTPVTVTADAVGNWSLTPAALADGAHNVSVTQTDAAGNVSPAATLGFTVDTGAPAAPTLVGTDDVAPVTGTIANGSTTNDSVPVLSGAAEPNATVTLTIDGGAPVTVVADGAGNWSHTPTALADGVHSVSVTQTDAAGNVSPAVVLGFTVDTAVPAAPTLIGTDDVAAITGPIAGGSTTNDNIPVLSGTAEPNATVTLTIDGTPVTVTADGAGNWSHTPTALADGLHGVSVTQTDAAGNVSPAATLGFTVDATAPTALAFTGTDDVSPVTGSIANGSAINDRRPEISGTSAEPNATVSITISGPTDVTVTVAANGAGAWSFTPGSDLMDGSYSVSVTQTDAAGNTSLAGAPLTFTLDSAAPLSISTITAITTDSGASSSDFVTSDDTLIVSGTNSPLAAGEVVQVSLDGGTTWTSTTPVTATSWSFDNTGATLAGGAHSFQTRVIDAAGNTGAVSSQAVVIDTTAPVATSTITAITADSGVAGDFVTSDNTLAISGANTALGAGEAVQLSLDGGASWVAVTPLTATSWSYNNTGTVLADGSYSLQTRVIDAAGNPGATSSQVVTIDTAAPSATSAITAISADSGTAGDFITNDTDGLTVTGTNTALAAGEVVQISLDGGATWVATTPATATSWTHATAPLGNGSYSFQTRVIDAGGLTGAVASQSVVIDASVPAAPTLAGTDDVAPAIGSIAAGSTTNDAQPALSGIAEPNATVTLTIDGTPVTVTADAAGNWSHVPAALADGLHSVSATQTDAAGNVSPATALAFTVDTSAPSATSTITTIAGDSATAGDFVTNDPTLTIAGANTALGAGEAVQLSLDGGTTWQAVAQLTATTWGFDNTGATLSAGTHTFQTRVIDAAGNVGTVSSQLVTIDMAAPSATSAITAIASDTGSSPSDFATGDQTLTINGTNTALAAGEAVQISLDNGATWSTAISLTGTTWSFDNTASPLADGSYTFRTRVIDAAGNAGAASSQAVTIDTTAPTATSTITAIASDSGSSSADFVTSDQTLTISGSHTALGAGEAVQVSLDNGVTWQAVTPVTATTWSFDNTGATLADGVYSFQTRVIDTAGNAGAASSQAVVIDTTAPLSISAITAITTDSGASSSDFITSDATLAISGSNSPLAAGEAVQISQDGGATWVSTTPVTATSWSFDNTGATLADGVHSFQTRVIDAAGNTGAVSSQAVTVDTGVPTATSSITAITTDSGASSSDYVTSDNTLAISGANTALGAGEAVQLSLDGGASWVAVTPVTATSWSYNNTGTVMADGSYSFQTRVIDAAGNTGTVSSQAVVIDTAVPSATSMITAISTDSGTAGDFVTSDSTLAIAGTNTALVAGEIVQISLDGGATWVSTTPVTGTSWTHASSALADGTYSFQTRVIDTGGLAGAVSTQAVRIDTGVPAAPGLAAADDQAPVVGSIANGSTTNDNVPALSGAAEPNATVTLTIDGTPVTVTADAAGNWSHTPTALADGLHSVSVTQTDAAGNVSPAAALAFTVDTTAPAAPTLMGADDQAPVVGAIANGSTTNDSVPVLSGAAEPNATVTITIDGGAPVTVTADGAGAWSFTPAALADGAHSVSVTQTDAAGNVSPAAALGFTVDTSVPAAPTLIGTDDVAATAGAIANGSTTNDNVPVFSGTAEPNAAMNLVIDGGAPVTVTANAAGAWSFTPAVLADGAHSVSVTQTDAAGNVSPAATLGFTVDATVPVAPIFTGTDDVSPVTGTIADGSTINDVRPAISGTTAEPGATVSITFAGPTSVTATVVANGAGAWSFTPGADLADGNYSVTVTQTDTAGNTSPAGAPLAFALDSAAPLSISTITAVTTDSGASSSDFITNDPTLTISGTNSPLAVGEAVQISTDGGVTWVSTTPVTATSWSFDNTGATLPSGSHGFQTRVIDAAGNTGMASGQTVVVDVSAPSATSSITAITNDSAAAGDFVTSDNTLAIVGANTALAAGETVQLSLDGGATWVSTTPVTATSWSYNNTGAVLADGSYNFQTRVIDVAGNTGTMASQVVVIDTAAPTATSSITAITADNGTAGDFITNDPTLVASGTNTALTAGETVQLSLDGGATWVSTTPLTATSWTFDNTGTTLADGTYSFQTRVIDAGGLTGTVSAQAVRIDTGVPAAPTLIGTDDVVAVTGAIAGGATTNDNVPVLSGTAQPGATVMLTIDGTPVSITADGAGNWSHTPAALADGLHNVSATQTDAAGNVSPAVALSFTVDATVPATPVFTGTDDVAPVTGTIANGSTINDVRPAISGTTAEPNATVTVTISGPSDVTATVVANGAGAWSFTPGSDLVDGSYSVSVTQTDAAGNTSPAGAPLTFTLDSAAPLSISTITAVTTDSGAGGDFVTSDPTLAISGSNSPLAAGEAVQISLDGGATWVNTTPVTATSWSFDNTAATLADGVHSFQTRVIDGAGNTGAVSSQAVAIDTTAPVATSTITAITADSGVAGDFVTSDNTLAISGANTALGAGEAVQLSLDGGASWVAVTPLTATSWSYNNTGTVLADGSYSLQTRVIDAAGNPGATSSQVVTIDTAAPSATSAITAISADSGTAGDFITNDTDGLTVTGTNTALAAGEVVQISLDGGATWAATTPVTGTSWTHATAALGNGSYSFQTRVIDAGSLTGSVATQTVRIDASVPAAPGLTASDDVAPVTGAIANGATTNDNQPALGGTAEPGATVTLTIDGTPVTVTADAAGNWSHTPAALANGAHSVSVTQTDAAGNVSPATALAFTVDTAAPAAPTLTAADDVAPVTGAIANGATTNDNVPVLSGAAEPNATVTLIIDGGAPVTVVANGAGNWSFTPTALTNGAHAVSVTQTDAAGNISPPAALGFTVDTAVPAAPTLIGTDDVAAMTGVIANGATTNDNVPVLTGTVEPNATVTLTIDGTPVIVTADGAGNWSHTPAALADGLHNVSATQTDAAGNVSPAVALSFTVDATAPATPAFTGTDDMAPVTGTIVNGSTINDVRPAISGTTAEPNATVTIAISGPTPMTATVVANGAGAWSFTPGSDLVDGSYSVSVTQTDAAGNTSPAGAPLTFTLDSAAPLSISTITAVTADSGTGGDFITSDPTLAISGSNSPLAAGEAVQISLDGGATWTGTTPVTGTSWSFDNTGATLADGVYSFQTRVIDGAGNTGMVSSQVVTIDTAGSTSTSSITAITTDSGTSPSDFITNDPTLAIAGANSPLAAGEAVQVSLDGGATWQAVTQLTGTSWSFDNTANTLSSGSHSVQTRVIDAAGNPGMVASQTVQIDTTPPTATIAIGAITADNGIAGDFQTNDPSLVVSGTVGAVLGAGEKVQISLDNGASWLDASGQPGAGTSWSHDATATTLPDGSYTFRARVIDIAGNTNLPASQAVLIDTSPSATVSRITAITDDNGAAGDFITNDQSLVVSGTISTALLAGEKVQVSLDGGTSWLDASGQPAGAGTSWSHDAQATPLGTPGSETSYTFQTRIVDAYGTPGAATSQAVVIDLAPPTATADITAISNDSGIVGDYITSDRTLIIDGSNTALAAGEKVQLSLDGGGTWVDVAMLSATAWSYNNTANLLSDGPQTFQTRVIDAGGNAVVTDTQAVQIIMDPPVVVTNIAAIGTDSGVAGDWITSDTTLTVSGTNGVLNVNPAWGEKVQLSFDNGATWVDVVQDTGSTWHYDNPTPLGATTHTLQSRVINAASLTGAVDTQIVTVDTSAPAVPVPTDVLTDTGGSTSDEITFDTTPTIQGTSEANATISIYRDGVLVGTTVANPTGDWAYTEAGALAGGPASTGVLYNYTATATDAAGNVSGPSANFSVRVDTAIAAPVIAGMSVDSGVSSADHNTSDTTPALSGTAEPGAVVQILRDAVSQGSVTADASGNWTYTSPALGGGSGTNSSGVAYVFTATQTDVAGNVSPATPDFVVTVDAIAPVGTMTLDLVSASDSGGLTSDNITNVVTPTMTVALGGLSTADVNSINAGQIVMTLWDDTNGDNVIDATETVHVRSLAFTATGGGGTGTASVTTTLPSLYDGAHPIKVQTVDLAGNVKTSTLDGTGQNLTIQHGGTIASASVATSLQPSDGLGLTMDSAGDFNGDGYEDMIVTAPHDQYGATAPNVSDFYVLFGTQNGLPTTANIDTLTSAQALHITNVGAAAGDAGIQGLVASSIGDINGDGFGDVLLTSALNDRAYVIFGRSAATPSFSLSTLNTGSTADGFWIDNNSTGGWLGSDGGGGHDYNNDGYADLLLGSGDGNSSESTPAGSGGGGMYYILYGHAGSGAAAWLNLDARPAGLFNDALNTQLASGTHTTVGSSLPTANHLGGKIQDVGDVNADGIHDYIVTDPLMAGGGTERGSAFLIFGQQGSIGDDFNLANLTPAQGIRLDGAMDYENLGGLSFDYGNNGSADAWYSGEGRTISSVGDINGDGIDDFAVGSPEWGDVGQRDGFAPGRVYVVYGKSSGWASGPIATQASGTTGFTLASSAATDQLLGYTIAGAGDVNGDGIDDFLVGAATGDAAAVDAGQVYLVYGQAGGGFASGNLETLVGAGTAVQINGAAAGDLLGTGIAVGDWNGDGIADYATGAWEGGAGDNGQIYSFIGSASKLTQTYATGNDTLAAGGTSIGAPAIVNGVDRISGGQGNDTITGIGTDTTGTAATGTLHDVAYGGMGDDVISLSGLVFTRVAGGTGTDTLALAGSGMNLDLAAYGNRVQGFEKFDLSSGGNTLHLRLSDVLNEPESTAELGHLEVKGGALSTVDLVDGGGTWSDVGDQTVGGVTYDVWRHSAMTNTLGDVWIQQGITVL